MGDEIQPTYVCALWDKVQNYWGPSALTDGEERRGDTAASAGQTQARYGKRRTRAASPARSLSDSEWEGDLEKEEAGQNTAGDTKARQVHLKLWWWS